MDLKRITRLNLGVWFIGTIVLMFFDRSLALSFGTGGLLGFLNFFLLGWLVEKFLLQRGNPVVLGGAYIGRLLLLFGLMAASVAWLEMHPVALVAGVGTILIATIIRAAIDAIRMGQNDNTTAGG